MLSENLVITELEDEVQQRQFQEVDIILEILADIDDSYFFGVDELKEALNAQTLE